jgi:hypothetical protein
MHIHIEGVSLRFGFDDVRTSQTLKSVRYQSNKERPVWCSIYVFLRVYRVQIIIYTSAWGFRRCSVLTDGQCEGLYIVDRAKDWLHVFYCIMGILTEKLKSALGVGAGKT